MLIINPEELDLKVVDIDDVTIGGDRDVFVAKWRGRTSQVEFAGKVNEEDAALMDQFLNLRWALPE